MLMDGPSQNIRLYAWLALLRAASSTDFNLSPLLESFGTAQAVLDAAGAGTIDRSHLPRQVLKALLKPDAQEIDREIRSLERPDYHLVPFDSPGYPPLLKQIAAPPPCLFVRGDPEVLGSCQVAIVGSRKPTMDGRRDARYFAGELARQGITVTSGLARGIDTEAHRGALGQQGRTVAVLGSGLDYIYPESNAELAEKISESGALVSEFPLSWRPLPHNFPRRNRVISGLSEAVLVVEAARRSGSLSTARHALEQNREVFAVPGSIRNPMKQGCHGLLREGAGLAQRVEDIADILGRCVNVDAATPEKASAGAGKINTLDEREKVLLDNIGYEPTGLDEIVNMTGFGIEDITGKLLNLELEGLITAVASGLYMRAEREPS